MAVARCGGVVRLSGLTAALVAGLAAIGAPVSAQTVGFGSSPGRASYRPASSWNDGPYYSTAHWNPYAPRRAVSNDFIESEPSQPPFGNVPHGLWGTYTPGRGALYPYAEGFSPYSGFADWYQSTYNFTPTRDQIITARTMFFESAPRPPDGVLPPLPPAPPPATVVVARSRVRRPRPRTPSELRRPKVVVPTPAPAAMGVRVYRSSVAG